MEKETRIAFTETEAAKQLGIARITLLRARQAGKINYCRIGRVVRYTPEQIEEFLKTCERSNASRTRSN